MGTKRRKRKLRKKQLEIKQQKTGKRQDSGCKSCEQHMRSNLRKAIRLTKVATREISQILQVDEKTVNAIRNALNDDVINEIQTLRQASADEMESWIAELGFDVLRVLIRPIRTVMSGSPTRGNSCHKSRPHAG